MSPEISGKECLGVKDCLLLRLPAGQIEDTRETENKDTDERERVSTENQVPYVKVRDLEKDKVGLFWFDYFGEYPFPQELWTIACGKLYHKMIIKMDPINQVIPIYRSQH